MQPTSTASPNAPTQMMTAQRRHVGLASIIASGVALVLLGGAVTLYRSVQTSEATVRGLRVSGQVLAPNGAPVPFARLDEALRTASEHALDRTITLRFGDQPIRVRRREAGFAVDYDRLNEAVRAVGRSGDPLLDLSEIWRARRGKIDVPLPARLDRVHALEFLGALKDQIDRDAADAKLDLEHHTVALEQPGRLLQVYQSLVALESAASSGDEIIELALVQTPPRITRDDLKAIDISTVLGTWETHYSSVGVDNDRTYNLKVGADHLNGHILKPHELFSFNEAVGDRTEREGYRVAPVIQGGELVDGLAGGMCQIASTLHAAAFFAGLEIVSSTPHSRPSAYIPMGLDSTVVYPTTDLKLRNPFDFPIVMHYQVNQGTVKVELLGRERPYKVVFEREILVETPYGSETRGDPQSPVGQRFPLQEGYPGYRAIRRRYRFDAKTALPRFLGSSHDPLVTALGRARISPVSVEKWTIHYPATTLIQAVGTGPKSMKKRTPPPSHHIPPIPPSEKPIGRILR